MLNQAVTIVLSLHVLAHSLFGCCDHGLAALAQKDSHPACCHGTVAHDDGHDSHESGSSTSGEHVGMHDDCARGRSPAPSHKPYCRHASCVWQLSDAAPKLDFWEVAAQPLPASASWFTAASLAACVGSPEFDVGRARALPLRLHLAVGVLLI